MYGDTVLGCSGPSLTALWNAFPRLVSTSRHVLVIVSSRFSLEDTSILMAGGTYGISSMSEVVGESGLEMGS